MFEEITQTPRVIRGTLSRISFQTIRNICAYYMPGLLLESYLCARVRKKRVKLAQRPTLGAPGSGRAISRPSAPPIPSTSTSGGETTPLHRPQSQTRLKNGSIIHAGAHTNRGTSAQRHGVAVAHDCSLLLNFT